MIYFQLETEHEAGLGEPCPCCGIDLDANHSCQHNLTTSESHWRQIENAQKNAPTFYHTITL
jgi:hypothetical protein